MSSYQRFSKNFLQAGLRVNSEGPVHINRRLCLKTHTFYVHTKTTENACVPRTYSKTFSSMSDLENALTKTERSVRLWQHSNNKHHFCASLSHARMSVVKFPRNISAFRVFDCRRTKPCENDGVNTTLLLVDILT